MCARHYWLLLLVMLIASGCARRHAHPPRGYLPSAGDAGQSAYGAWAAVDHGDPRQTDEGELIAVHNDSMFVLHDDGVLQAIPSWDVSQLTLVTIDGGAADGMVGWVILGTLSTTSNGLYLIYTAPMWLLLGTASAVSASDTGIVSMSNTTLGQDLAAAQFVSRSQSFARFPMGLLPQIDRTKLRPKYYDHPRPPKKKGQWSID